MFFWGDIMKIVTTNKNNVITLNLEGKLDTTTSSDLEQALSKIINKTKFNLVLDFKDLSYLSSAGLRVLLAAQKKANELVGNIVVRNVNNSIMEVFNVTGFSDFLNIEKPNTKA